ncbi:MAG: D-glycerate dehydrogenase, partial [SAR324 cluster bacterium]|nr:D-glycerate dehydrogenase [SAR324 cluster bacterium]
FVVTDATADQAMALMLAASRRIWEGARYVRDKQWKEWSPTLMIANDVHRKTLGIVGMGRIGQAIARRARGFDMNLLYHARSPKPEAERDLGVSYRALDDLLAESDIVILILPLTEETRHMINDETLAKMKPSAYLINSARGPIVDPAALYRALSEGRLAGAALDVTEPEPISADDPLLSLENCLIVPHISTSTWETRAMMTEVSVTNLLNGLQGEPLMHCANPDVIS